MVVEDAVLVEVVEAEPPETRSGEMRNTGLNLKKERQAVAVG